MCHYYYYFLPPSPHSLISGAFVIPFPHPPTYEIHRGDNKRDNLTMRFVYINIFICTYRSFEVYLFSRRKGCYLFEERERKNSYEIGKVQQLFCFFGYELSYHCSYVLEKQAGVKTNSILVTHTHVKSTVFICHISLTKEAFHSMVCNI